MFISVLSVIETLIGLPFAYYKTFKIEEKHGFNKEVNWLLLVNRFHC